MLAMLEEKMVHLRIVLGVVFYVRFAQDGLVSEILAGIPELDLTTFSYMIWPSSYIGPFHLDIVSTDQVKAALLPQLPWLKEVDFSGLHPGNLPEWLATQKEKYGEWIEIGPVVGE